MRSTGRFRGWRWLAVSVEQLAGLAGVGLAASGLAALLTSEHAPLFGFMEHGYRFVIVLTIASEAAAIALLTLFLVRTRSRAHDPERRSHRSDPALARRSEAKA